MSKYKIDKGVPIPDPTKRAYPERIYPFDDMEVGDSFAVPVTEKKEANIRTIASREAKKSGGKKKFTVMRTGDVLRVWRIE